jgi:dienelactone hydrolase
MRTVQLVVVSSSLLLGAGAAAADEPFAYDRAAPLNVKELSVERAGGVETRALVLSGAPLEREVDVRLVLPQGAGPFPAVIFLHMYPGSNEQFLDEARLLAREGVLSLLVEGSYPWHRRPHDDLDYNRKGIVLQLLELQRAVDLLAARKDVDPKRIAYVGMDYGAMHGAVLASIEKRIRCYALLVPTTRYAGWDGIVSNALFDEEYDEGMKPLDPIERIGRASAPLLFQFASKDSFVARDYAEQLVKGAHEPKTVRWYDGNHEVPFREGQADRLTWLRGQLGIPPRGP